MLSTIIIFIIVIAVLIFVHELGHFLVARYFGIRVDEFAIGFGPKLWKKTVTDSKHGTIEYSIRAIPFGGFVKIFGETPDETSMHGSDSHRSFVRKPRLVQAAVLVAGIVFNILFAWMIVSLAFMLGAPVSPDSYPQYTNEIKNVRVIVLDVDHGSPADKAGIKIGDSITSVNGKNITDPSSEVASIRERIDGTKGVPILLNNISVTPLKGEHPELPDMYAVGISMDIAGTLRLPPLTAVKEGWKFVWYMITSTFGVIGALITGLFHADNTVLSHVTGPIGIAGEVGNAVHIGFTYLLMLTALISVNLAVLNLVPFPALDGGRILFVGIESIIRKQIKPSIANAVNAIGFILLMILMVVVAYHDIVTKVLGK